MKKIITVAVLFVQLYTAQAQLYTSTGTTLFIDNGAVVSVNGGDVTLNSPITGAGTGKLVLKGTVLQNIINNGNNIFGVEIDNTNNALMNHNLVIDGVLTLTNGALQVNGKQLTLSGTALGNTGTITGSALSELFVNGSGAFGTLYFTAGNSNSLFKNITLNRTASGTATLGSNVRVSDVVTITNGTLNSNGFLTLQSNATGTARVAVITAGNGIIGNVTTERFIQGGLSNAVGAVPGRRAFRFLSHPFNTYSNLSQLTNQIDITGAGATATPTAALFTQTSTNAPSSFWYNPMASDGNIVNDAGWTAFTNTLPANATDANAWKVGQGVRVLVRGAKGEGLSGGNYTASDVTLSMAGSVNVLTSSLNYTLQTNGSGLGYGWNLIGNPLPSPVEIQTKLKTLRESNSGGTNSNLNAIAYVWNPNKTNTSRGGWEAIDLTIASNYILPMHGVVLVQTTTNNNNVVNFSEADKIDGTGVVNLFRTSNAANALSIELQDAAGNVLDETMIRFNGNASKNFESYDGGKLINQYALFSRTADNTNIYLQSLPTPQQNDSIVLGVRSSEAKTFQLAVNDFNMPAGMQAYLKDKKLNALQPIGNGFIYPYSVTNDTATQGDNRFELVFKTNGVLPIAGINLKAAQQNSSSIKVDYNVLNEINMNQYEVEKSIDGQTFTKQTIQTATANNGSNPLYSWIDNNISIGNNYYRIKGIGKNGSVQYSSIVNVKIGGKASITIVPNPVVDKKAMLQLSNISKGLYTINIYNSAGQKVVATIINHIGGSGAIPISLGNVAAGNYIVTIEGAYTKENIKIVVQ